jgi:uncharacterized membrane protein
LTLFPSPLARALLLSCGGLLCLAVTPPLQVPDALSHYRRAFQIGELQLFSEKREKQTGSELPKAIELDGVHYGDLPFNSELSITPAEWRSRYDKSLHLTPENLADRRFQQLSQIGLYSPVTYLPQALAIRLAVLLRLRNIAAIYLAGLASLAACSLLLYLAFRVLAFSRRASNFCFLVAGMPMSLFLIGSINADGPTICLAILVLALALRLRHRFEPRLFWALVAATLLLGLCKSLYFLVAVAAIPIALPGLFSAEGRERLGKAALLLGSAVVPAFLWGLLNRGQWTPLRREVHIDPEAQLLLVLDNPIQFVGLIVQAVQSDPRFIHFSFVGILGWLDTLLPPWLIYGYSFLLLATLVVAYRGDRQEKPIGAGSRLAVAAIAFAFLCALALGAYLTWNVVGAGELRGLHGRYFIPLAPFALAVIPPLLHLAPAKERYQDVATVGAWGVATVVLSATLLTRYWNTD